MLSSASRARPSGSMWFLERAVCGLIAIQLFAKSRQRCILNVECVRQSERRTERTEDASSGTSAEKLMIRQLKPRSEPGKLEQSMSLGHSAFQTRMSTLMNWSLQAGWEISLPISSSITQVLNLPHALILGMVLFRHVPFSRSVIDFQQSLCRTYGAHTVLHCHGISYCHLFQRWEKVICNCAFYPYRSGVSGWKIVHVKGNHELMHHFHPLYHKSQVTNHGRRARLAYIPFFCPKRTNGLRFEQERGREGKGLTAVAAAPHARDR